jgi:hypothetical protein
MYTGTSTCNTVVVGSRAAVRSVLETVTIIGFDESETVRGYHRGYRQIVVNESRTLQDMGYQVMNGTGWNVAEPTMFWEYNPIWDHETKVLTIEGFRMFRDMIELCFEPSWSGHHTILLYPCVLLAVGLSYGKGTLFPRTTSVGSMTISNIDLRKTTRVTL